MRHFIRSRLLSRGLWLQRTASLEQISRLIADLRPMPIDRDLIRIGPPGDGGYLIPDDLQDIVACISPGVSSQVGFDQQIADRDIVVLMADGSVTGPPVEHANFQFYRKFLDNRNSDSTITMDSLCAEAPSEGDLILQMDIEGAEYRVLNSISEGLLHRFRIIAIEFHDLTLMFSPFGLREIGNVFQKLLSSHVVTHIHPNNFSPPFSVGDIIVPPTMEFTFYRKDRCSPRVGVLTLPHPLDADNSPDEPPLPLPDCWRCLA